jgi:transposase
MENKKNVKRRKPKTLTQEERMGVVKLHYLEGRSQASLAREYGVSESVVSRIISNFAAENDKSTLFMKKDAKASESEEIKALRKEVLELKKKLYDETMRADFFETMVDVSEEMFGIEIRKKAGIGQSKGCAEEKSNIQ